MDRLPFSLFANPVDLKLKELSEDSTNVFVNSSITGDELYSLYLSTYPKEVNTVFRERLEYDGNYDKNYIRRLGNVVVLKKDGTKDTIWNVKTTGYFQEVANTLHKALIEAPYSSYFLTSEPTAGNVPNVDNHNKEITWTHFYSIIPKRFISHNVAEVVGDLHTSVSMLKHTVEVFTKEAATRVHELIENNLLYRGSEHLHTVKTTLDLLENYQQATDKDHFLWHTVAILGQKVRVKNTVIGTLIDDLSQGELLEKAVAKFESKVAPENYKRTTALITPKMVENAQAKLTELGLVDSLYRRYATLDEIDVSSVLFKAKPEISLNLFDDLKKESSQQISRKNLEKTVKDIAEITIDEFISNVLPTVTKLEVLFENQHTTNLVSLITEKYKDSNLLFKWNNPFSWSYNGGIADSALRSKVEALGGRVDGVLRFSHTWNYDIKKPNQSLMDLHVFFPGYVDKTKISCYEGYPSTRRVGWNQRQDKLSGASQDVDYVNAPGTNVPVENITFPSLEKMPEGTYTFKIHNWSLRQPTKSGFKAEIEFNGEIHEYEMEEPLKNKEWVTLAEVTLKDGQFNIEHKMKPSVASKTVWNIPTNTFVTVDTVCLSPNYWGDNAVGNKHFFFMLNSCKNPLDSLGFYNEFLKPELNEHRKVFEVLASKTKTELSENQVSGLGFSSTKRDSLIVRIQGKTKQTFKINF